MRHKWRVLLLSFVLIFTITGKIWAQDDEEFSGEIEEEGQEDEYSIELEEGDGVIITAEASRGSDLDTILKLLNPDGDVVEMNDDYESDSYNSQIVHVAEDDGEYTIVVSGYQDSTGEYEVTVEYVSAEEAQEASGEVDTTPQREPDFTFEGEVEDGEEDEYPIELEEGQGLIAAVYGTDAEIDTMVSLRDPDGIELITNDDRGDYDTLDSQLAFIAQEDGEYTIIVSNYPESPGEYRLEIYFASEEETAFAEQALRVVLTGEVETFETDNFVIHYTTEGEDEADEDYIEEVADAVEETLEIQMELGWAQPPNDLGQGGDERYDVYIVNLPDIYGYASSSSPLGDNPYTDGEEENAQAGFLVLDNSYSEYNDPLQAMRATVAHEFHHVVQFGYDSEEPMQWYFESTASWMETVTFPRDEEATIYVSEVYGYPEICFAGEGEADVSGLGVYGTWLFFDYATHYIDEDFGILLWENIIEEDGFDALETTLEEFDMTIPEAVAQYHLVNIVRDYELADDFDGATVDMEDVIDDEGEWEPKGDGVQELAANIYEFSADEDTYTISIESDNELILYAIGIDGDEAEVFELGTEGVIDNDGYDNFYIMVFNTEYDDSVTSCDYAEYTITVDSTNDDANEIAYNLNAEHFEELDD
jgi:hypothetical protein